MTRPVPLQRNRRDAAREALRHNAVGQQLSLGGLRVRVGDLPLFRRSEDGLLQAVRIVFEGSEPERPVRVVLRRGDEVLDHTAVPAGHRQAALLFVPEVAAPSQLVLQVGDLTAPIRVRPQRKWRVFVVNQSHLDIGYTDPQGQVLRSQMGYLDAVLDLVAGTGGWPEPARFRWNVEATWPLEHWLRARPARQRQAFLELARAGLVEVCALPFSMHTEAYSMDELARQLAFADRLREEHGLSVTTAMQTDVPGATIGLLELLAGAGVRYLSVAHNYAGRSVPYRHGGQRLTRPFRWRAPSGKELLAWFTDTLFGSAYMEGNLLGLAEGYEAAAELLPEYLAALAERPYPYQGESSGWLGLPPDVEVSRPPYPFDLLHLRVNGEHADNAPPSRIPAEVVRRWNQEWAYPQLRTATNRDFFQVVEKELDGRLDTFEGDWTDWWADGIGSAAGELSRNRQAQSLAPTAQTMHVLADALGDAEGDWQAEVDACYRPMALFDEHTWGAADPWGDALDRTASGKLQWQRKAAFALDAHDRAVGLHQQAAVRLGDLLGGDQPAVAVFNPSPWPRTDLVEVFLPEERAGGERLRLLDAESGQAVPFELIPQVHARYRPRGRRLRFVAREVPSLGYRRYLLQAGGDEPRVTPAPGPLENEHYRLEVDPAGGHLVSLVDRALDRELVHGASLFGFNQYVYDRYTSAPHFNHLSSRIGELGAPWLLGSRTAAARGIVSERARTPIGRRLTVRLVGESAPVIETTYELLDGVPRVDIRNRVHKVASPDKESVYFAFPFRVDEPTVSWEITGGVDTGAAPRVPGAARHMRAIRHWLTLEGDGVQVAWATGDAPLVQLGMLHLPYAPFPPSFEADGHDQATVFSWAMNNIWDTNFPSEQGGEVSFRYALASSEPGDIRRLGRETAAGLARPLVGLLCVPGLGGKTPPSGSFCTLEGGNVDVVTIAPSHRDGEVAVFLHSLDAGPADLRLGFPLLPVRRAWLGNCLDRDATEVPVREGEVGLRIQPGEYRALRLELARR